MARLPNFRAHGKRSKAFEGYRYRKVQKAQVESEQKKTSSGRQECMRELASKSRETMGKVNKDDVESGFASASFLSMRKRNLILPTPLLAQTTRISRLQILLLPTTIISLLISRADRSDLLACALLEPKPRLFKVSAMFLGSDHHDYEGECCDRAEEDALNFGVVGHIFAIHCGSKVVSSSYVQKRESLIVRTIKEMERAKQK